MWVNVGGRSKLVQVVFYGQGHHCCILYLYIFPLRFNSQPRENMLGYPPRLRLHLGWLIIFLQTMKLGYSRCLYCIVIISEMFVI
jgi:hypothetical protein